MQSILSSALSINIHPGIQAMAIIETISRPQAQDIILDVRHPDETERRPLIWPTNKIIRMPFFQIKKQLDELDRHQSYLLYCEKGIMSRLHADALRKNGFEKIAVFTP